ncbi:glycoside hydrolase family 15 protein [Schumannella luteola]
MTTSAIPDVELAALARHSVELILRLQDPSGAYPASPTFSAYQGYSWFRDGAFIADAVSAYGEAESAGRFHDWCSGILTARAGVVAEIVAAAAAGEPVPDERMLATRFTFAGAEGTDEWWDFQLDGYGTWLWAVVEHAQRHGLSLEPWRPAIELAVDYLLSSWQRPCFDWWEEHAEHVHVSTLGCIAAGLRAAEAVVDAARADACADAVARIRSLIARGGMTNGHLAKWLGSTEVDASLAALVSPLGVYPADSAIGRATISALDEQLAVDGGVHRYLLDTFFGGGQWPLLSCFLGLAYADAGETDRARQLLEWAASTVTDTGDLPEQVSRHLLFPDREQEWIDRWGTVATPLLWSHAMLVRLQVRLGEAR